MVGQLCLDEAWREGGRLADYWSISAQVCAWLRLYTQLQLTWLYVGLRDRAGSCAWRNGSSSWYPLLGAQHNEPGNSREDMANSRLTGACGSPSPGSLPCTHALQSAPVYSEGAFQYSTPAEAKGTFFVPSMSYLFLTIFVSHLRSYTFKCRHPPHTHTG
jgi:hypothetical protein